jgi:hypothetical protein
MKTNNELSSGTPSTAFLPPPAAIPQPDKGYLALIDSILRNRESFFTEIFSGQNLGARVRMFLLIIAVLSFIYGITMGTAAFSVSWERGFLQVLSSGLKVPILYLLTTAICFPALFIILVLMGSRLTFLQTLALILLALTLNAILLAAFAPIVLFFVITDSSYEFVKLLHVAVMAFSGFWAMAALWHGLREMCERSNLYPRQAIRIMQIWILVFGFVGTQMAWSLRPFIGTPDAPFQIFRPETSNNIYRSVLTGIGDFFKNARD